MKILNNSAFKEVEEFLRERARGLERLRFANHFKGGNVEAFAEELKEFQNEDGGFGNGIEPDFRMPDSSPMATSIGLRYLKKIDNVMVTQEMIESAITYLERSFDESRNGWWAVSEEVNEHPHAWWWDYEDGMTIIDKNWGNPSAEIIGYLYRYRNYTDFIDVDSLIDYALDYIKGKEKFESENELYCFIHMYEEIPRDKAGVLEKHIARGVEQLIVYDKERWNEYVPTPVDFVKSSDSSKFGVDEEKIEENLDYLVEKLDNGGVLEPPWDISVYEGGLEDAFVEWKGILTLEALMVLDEYDRIQR